MPAPSINEIVRVIEVFSYFMSINNTIDLSKLYNSTVRFAATNRNLNKSWHPFCSKFRTRN